MTKTDEKYLGLLKDILENGRKKPSRSGDVLSVFGRQLRFNLKDEFPILTTKKMFWRGALHELLWFLKGQSRPNGNVNIKYLIDNNVGIWTDDAYRWFKNTVIDKISKGNDELKRELMEVTREDFIEKVRNSERIENTADGEDYWYGDLGPVYGRQWRNYNGQSIDQINDVIEKLKKDPFSRRIMCLAYNPCEIKNMALPPCHVMMQFYVREPNEEEKIKYGGKLMLSCMWTQRSVDAPLGLCWNIVSYGFMTYMIARLVGMEPDELVGSLGDCHIYLNQIDGVQEQLSRSGYNEIPKLVIEGKQNSIEDFKAENFKLIGYKSEPHIKIPLSVG